MRESQIGYELIFEKSHIQICWHEGTKTMRFFATAPYTLNEAIETNIEFERYLIEKKACNLIFHIPYPLQIPKEIIDFTVNHSIPHLNNCGIKYVAFIYYKGEEELPFLIKTEENTYKIASFDNEYDALNWFKQEA